LVACRLFLRASKNVTELFQSGFEILDNLFSDYLRVGEILKVKIPARYKEALEKLRLLTGRSMSESITEGLMLFFEELKNADGIGIRERSYWVQGLRKR
jgi:hypothetical protein